MPQTEARLCQIPIALNELGLRATARCRQRLVLCPLYINNRAGGRVDPPRSSSENPWLEAHFGLSQSDLKRWRCHPKAPEAWATGPALLRRLFNTVAEKTNQKRSKNKTPFCEPQNETAKFWRFQQNETAKLS